MDKYTLNLPTELTPDGGSNRLICHTVTQRQEPRLIAFLRPTINNHQREFTSTKASANYLVTCWHDKSDRCFLHKLKASAHRQSTSGLSSYSDINAQPKTQQPLSPMSESLIRPALNTIYLDWHKKPPLVPYRPRCPTHPLRDPRNRSQNRKIDTCLPAINNTVFFFFFFYTLCSFSSSKISHIFTLPC